MLICSFSTPTLLEGGRKSLFTVGSGVEGNEGEDQLQELSPVSFHQGSDSQEKKNEAQHARYWEPATNQLQELREVNLQEIQEANLQEVREVRLKEAQEPEPVKVRPEEKGQLKDLLELQEGNVQEVEQVLLQEVEPVVSLQEVVELPWLAGLTRSRKVRKITDLWNKSINSLVGA